MTYEDIVKKAKQAAKNIDAKTIKEHIAIQQILSVNDHNHNIASLCRTAPRTAGT